MKNLLLICETSNFKTFTRRATAEAIKKAFPNTYVVANLPVRKMFTKHLKSHYFSHIPYLVHYTIPILNYEFSAGIEVVKKFDEPGNIIVLSSPRQHYILDKIEPKSKLAVILSDPYHLMGYSFEDTKKILTQAELIFATSKSLSTSYLTKYFPKIDANVVYWPNTVDTNIWDVSKISKAYSNSNDITTVGFAGNIMEVTDLDLLDYITTACPNMVFKLAGKIKLKSKKDRGYFSNIIDKDNVDYLGYIDYEDLPKVVYQWDIGMLIDKKTELSSYHHHNKLYQYLAMGKPVVAYRNHDDYDYLSEVVNIADNPDEFISALKKSASLIGNSAFTRKAVYFATENNADSRAFDILNILTNDY